MVNTKIMMDFFKRYNVIFWVYKQKLCSFCGVLLPNKLGLRQHLETDHYIIYNTEPTLITESLPSNSLTENFDDNEIHSFDEEDTAIKDEYDTIEQEALEVKKFGVKIVTKNS